MKKDTELVTVATYEHDWQAHIAKGVLEEAGIPSVIDNEIFSSVVPLGMAPWGGVRLKVFARDEQRASQLISK